MMHQGWCNSMDGSLYFEKVQAGIIFTPLVSIDDVWSEANVMATSWMIHKSGYLLDLDCQEHLYFGVVLG